MHPEEDRERLRQTFDSAATRYDRIRPDYPEALFDDLVALAGLTPGDRLLEVGCATGKATRPLARRGFRITCVELGTELAAVARQNLAGFGVEVVQAPFEEWQPPHPFGLVYAATAWHWIDPGVRYQRAWQALRPGGHLAFWAAGHVFPEGGDPFFEEIQDIYDEIGEGQPPGRASRGRANSPTNGPGSRPAGSSRSPPSATTAGNGSTRPRSTSSCSRPSPGTWPWPSGNGGGCTARSGGGWRCAATTRCGGDGGGAHVARRLG